MKRVISPLAAAFIALASTAAIVHADFESERLENWHQWRGPNADGAAVQANPPLEWGPDRNVKWKIDVPGEGTASPIVWQDRVFVLSAIETDRKAENAPAAEASAEDEGEQRDGPDRSGRGGRGGRGGRRFGGDPPPTNYWQFVVLCYNRESGEEMWRQVAAEEVPHEGHHQTNTFASGSPITDGEYVYASFGSRGIYCYDMEGNLQWKQDLGDMQTRLGFGEGSSPALHGDVLVVPWDQETDSAVYALDARTGDVKWRTERDEVSNWGTPLIIEAGDGTQVVLNGSNRVVSYDLETGKELWKCGGQTGNAIPSPVRQDEVVYCMTGFRQNAVYAIPLNASGDITDTDKIAWRNTEAGPYVPSPVLYEGVLYFNKSNDAILTALEAETGEPLIKPTRVSELGSMYASPIAAAGRIYFTDRDGKTLVLQHGPEMEKLALNDLGEPVDASPAIVGNQIFIRGADHLYCIEQQ
jgi:outer membrane protein assembly factor BamB